MMCRPAAGGRHVNERTLVMGWIISAVTLAIFILVLCGIFEGSLPLPCVIWVAGLFKLFDAFVGDRPGSTKMIIGRRASSVARDGQGPSHRYATRAIASRHHHGCQNLDELVKTFDAWKTWSVRGSRAAWRCADGGHKRRVPR
jgi:hypothetical protein